MKPVFKKRPFQGKGRFQMLVAAILTLFYQRWIKPLFIHKVWWMSRQQSPLISTVVILTLKTNPRWAVDGQMTTVVLTHLLAAKEVHRIRLQGDIRSGFLEATGATRRPPASAWRGPGSRAGAPPRRTPSTRPWAAVAVTRTPPGSGGGRLGPRPAARTHPSPGTHGAAWTLPWRGPGAAAARQWAGSHEPPDSRAGNPTPSSESCPSPLDPKHITDTSQTRAMRQSCERR